MYQAGKYEFFFVLPKKQKQENGKSLKWERAGLKAS
jgi:hypothetical protein